MRFLANTDRDDKADSVAIAELSNRPSPSKKPIRRDAERIDPRLISAINVVGGNINQIAKAINSGHSISSLEVLHTLTQMSRALDRIADAAELLTDNARQNEKKEAPK